MVEVTWLLRDRHPAVTAAWRGGSAHVGGNH